MPCLSFCSGLNVLTHWGLVTPYGDNGLLPGSTKPLPELALTNHKWGLVALTWGEFHMECSRYLFLYEFHDYIIQD